MTNALTISMHGNRRQSDTPKKKGGVTTQLTLSISGVTAVNVDTALKKSGH